jgi:hypothetical protein
VKNVTRSIVFFLLMVLFSLPFGCVKKQKLPTDNLYQIQVSKTKQTDWFYTSFDWLLRLSDGSVASDSYCRTFILSHSRVELTNLMDELDKAGISDFNYNKGSRLLIRRIFANAKIDSIGYLMVEDLEPLCLIPSNLEALVIFDQKNNPAYVIHLNKGKVGSNENSFSIINVLKLKKQKNVYLAGPAAAPRKEVNIMETGQLPLLPAPDEKEVNLVKKLLGEFEKNQ